MPGKVFQENGGDFSDFGITGGAWIHPAGRTGTPVGGQTSRCENHREPRSMKPKFSAFIAFSAQSCTLVSHHRPHRKIRRFGDGWFGRIRWIFPNRGRQDCLQKQGCRTHLACCVDSTCKPRRLPQEPHPPRRAHDTLQPKDESIIVGYYTSAGSAPRPAGRTNVKGDLWRETTGLTVPAQET